MDMAQFAKSLDKFIKDLPETQKEYHNSLGRRWIEIAQDKTPVDTGRMRISWRHYFDHAQLRINNPAQAPGGTPYASFVEFGFRHYLSGRFIPGHQIMARTTHQIMEGEAQQIYDGIITSAWDGAMG